MASAPAQTFPPLPEYKGKPGWEFTPLKDIDVDAMPAVAGVELSDPERALFALESVVVPGETELTSEGPLVMPLKAALESHPELVEAHLGTVAKDGPFAARNAAQWTDGSFVYVPRGVQVDAPILLTQVHGEDGSALHTRTLIVLEDGAEAEVWEQTLSADDDSAGLVNGVVELVVGQNARLRYIGGQDVNEKTWVFGSQRGIVSRDGHLDWITLGFGGKDGKVFLETKLDGPGAHGAVTGAYASRHRQHIDFDTLQEHAAPNTTSDLAFRGIVNDRSSVVWRGMIQVDPGAQQTDAFQESRNLLLTKRAHADAIPGLEILADDVRCTHAAAIAKIDDEQVFYLRSHGLPEAKAQRLVVEGFLSALVERFAQGDVRETVAAALDKRLATVLA